MEAIIIYIIVPIIAILFGAICIIFTKVKIIEELLKGTVAKNPINFFRTPELTTMTEQIKAISKCNVNLQSTVDNLVDKVKLLSAKVQLLEENKKVPTTNNYKALMIRTLDGIKQINETILNEVSEKGYFIINSSPDEILYNSERAKDCNLQIEITPEDNHYVILFKKKKYDSK